MKKLFLLLIFVGCAYGTALPVTYGKLSSVFTSQRFRNVTDLLPNLVSDLQPEDLAAYYLEDALLNSRNLIDVFAYAYGEVNGEDKWQVLRDIIDQGFEALRDFNQLRLSDVNFTSSEAADALKKCLDWKEAFENLDREQKFLDYIQNPLINEMFIRSKKKLTQYFWGGTTEIPSIKLSGLQNIAFVLRGVLANALDDYDDFVGIKNVIKHHGSFNDYRKIVRSAYFLSKDFPSLYNISNYAQLIYLNDFHRRIIGVDNIYDGYLFYTDVNEDPEKAAQKEENLDQYWNALVAWAKVANIDGYLKAYSAHVISS